MQETQQTQVQCLEVGKGNPLQCSCLENSMERGAWQVTVHEAKKSQTMVLAFKKGYYMSKGAHSLGWCCDK